MRHLTESELSYALKRDKELTIRGYLQICKDVDEEEVAIAASIGLPDELQRRVSYNTEMFNAEPKRVFKWAKIQ